jgi:hypothetical protein
MISNDQIITDGATTFSQLQDTFAAAALAHPTGRRQLDITCAGHSIRLNLVGIKLARQLAQSFGHLITSIVPDPELTIQIWDAAESGVQLRSDSNAQRKLDGFDILFRTSKDNRYFCEQRDASLSWLDSSSSQAAGYIASADAQYPDQLGRPFQKMITAWLHEQGVQSIHAGLVGVGETGLLFVGNAGVGKTTSTISCLQAGMNYLGDDIIGLQADTHGFQGHSLFATCLVAEDHLKRFPYLQEHSLPTSYSPEEKSVVFLNQAFHQQIKSSVSIKAIVLPNIVNRVETTYRPASKPEALFALAPTSVMFLPRPTQASFNRLAEMVQQIPAYWLDLGQKIDSIPGSISNLASEVSHS